jgi:hypothetical protein
VRPVNRFLVAMLVVIVLMFILESHARADTWGVATVASYHFDDREHCQYNPGLGIEQDMTENTRFIAGFYKNSPCRQAVYAAVAWMPVRFGPARLGVAVGVVSGYKSHPVPMAVPTLWIEGNEVGVNIMAVPRIDADKPAVVGLQVKFKF